MRKFLFLLLISFASLSFSSLTFAKGNEGDYLIEVIIFSQNPGLTSSEKPGAPYVLQTYNKPALKLNITPTWEKLATNLGPIFEPVEKQLVRQARAIQRSKDYKLLLHEAWKMYLVDADKSVDILVEGGDYYSEVPELIGSLNLSVARYLHLQTNLNLNSFAPIPLISASNSLIAQQKQQQKLLNLKFNALALKEESQLPENSKQVSGNFYISKTASMQQKRRMRSNELHFIDSPYLGLLIKIQRYKEEEQEENQQENEL